MGLGSKLALIGIPIGIAVFALAVFQNQIRQAFFTAGQTVGQTVTSGIEGFLEPFSKLGIPSLPGPTATQPLAIVNPIEAAMAAQKKESVNLSENIGFGAGIFTGGNGRSTPPEPPRPQITVRTTGETEQFLQDLANKFKEAIGATATPGIPVGIRIPIAAGELSKNETKSFGLGAAAQAPATRIKVATGNPIHKTWDLSRLSSIPGKQVNIIQRRRGIFAGEKIAVSAASLLKLRERGLV